MDLQKQIDSLTTELIAQGSTISDLQIKISNLTDRVHELESELWHLKND